jgi:hypothetical protein
MLCGMNRQSALSHETRIAGFTPWALWRLVRVLVRGLSVLHFVARALPGGRVRAGMLRELGRGLGLVETAVRCLLLMMRAPAGASVDHARITDTRMTVTDLPATVTQDHTWITPESHDVTPAPRFSLRLALPDDPGPRPINSVFACLPPSRAPRRAAGQAARLGARLAALRLALSQAEAEAARMAAYMNARGFRRAALKPLRLWAGFGPGPVWAACPVMAIAPPAPDTS